MLSATTATANAATKYSLWICKSINAQRNTTLPICSVQFINVLQYLFWDFIYFILQMLYSYLWLIPHWVDLAHIIRTSWIWFSSVWFELFCWFSLVYLSWIYHYLEWFKVILVSHLILGHLNQSNSSLVIWNDIDWTIMNYISRVLTLNTGVRKVQK